MRTGLISITCALLLSAPAFAVTGENLPPSITVSGSGKAYARPDTADINLGVTTDATTAQAALAANNQAMASLIAGLKQQGIDEKDVMTSNFNVSPQYRPYQQGDAPNRRPEIIGYRVDNQVHVKVRKLANLGTLLDQVVKTGANNINGISFTLAQPDPVMDKARAMAVEDAHRKAGLYAQSAGVKLGRVLYITESSGRTPVPPMPMRMMAAAAPAVPIAVGEEELDSTITIVYAIE